MEGITIWYCGRDKRRGYWYILPFTKSAVRRIAARSIDRQRRCGPRRRLAAPCPLYNLHSWKDNFISVPVHFTMTSFKVFISAGQWISGLPVHPEIILPDSTRSAHDFTQQNSDSGSAKTAQGVAIIDHHRRKTLLTANLLVRDLMHRERLFHSVLRESMLGRSPMPCSLAPPRSGVRWSLDGMLKLRLERSSLLAPFFIENLIPSAYAYFSFWFHILAGPKRLLRLDTCSGIWKVCAITRTVQYGYWQSNTIDWKRCGDHTGKAKSQPLNDC